MIQQFIIVVVSITILLSLIANILVVMQLIKELKIFKNKKK